MNDVTETQEQQQTNELRAADQPVVVTAAQMQTMTVGQLAEIDKTLQPMVEAGNFVIDCSTKDGYEKSRKFYLNQCRPLKSTITTTHKTLKEPLLATTKKLDVEKARLLAKLESIGKPHHDAYRARDIEVEQEKNRIAGLIQQAHNLLLQYENRAVAGNVELIQSFIDLLVSGEIDESVFNSAKVREEYSNAVGSTLGKLKVLRQAAEDRATVAKFEAEQAEKQRIEDEAKAERDRIKAAKAKEVADELAAANKAQQALIDEQKEEMRKMKALLQAQQEPEPEPEPTEPTLILTDIDNVVVVDNKTKSDSGNASCMVNTTIEQELDTRKQDETLRYLLAYSELNNHCTDLLAKLIAKDIVSMIVGGNLPNVTFNQ